MSDNRLFDIGEDNVPDGFLKGKYKDTWLEDSLSFNKPVGKQTETKQTNSYLGASIKGKQLFFLSVIVGLGLLIVFGRVFYLQGIKGNSFREMAEGNRIRIKPIVSERGVIYDKWRKQLVENVPDFSLVLIPQDLPADEPKRQNIIEEVSKISGVAEGDIKEILGKYRNYTLASLIIKQNLDYESALELYIRSSNLPGISIEKGSKRFYISDPLESGENITSLSHVLGYLGKLNEDELQNLKTKGYLPFDNIGKVGLEQSYEELLRGSFGKKKIEVDAVGRERTVLAEDAPIPGKNLVLTLDVEAQSVLEKEMRTMMQRGGAKRAAAIAMNPNDGSVLAMVSLPAFDNNKFSGGIKTEDYNIYIDDRNLPLFNRAIGGTYPSGSTAKLIVAAAALEEKIINKTTVFLSVGGLHVGNWYFKDWKAGGHGITNVTKALAWSVNTFFYYIGGGYGNFVGLGADRLYRYMAAFNLGEKTGIDIPGEASGFIPTRDWKLQTKGEKWYVGDTYNISIGQGDLLITPLQVAVWTSVVANKSNIVRPHLLDKIEDGQSSVSVVDAPARKAPISTANLDIVAQGMRECVTYGSCKLLGTLPFAAAGKTGTAQWSPNKEPHAWFTSFAPYENPKIVVVVLVEEGKEGSSVAMPIAKNFLSWWGRKYLK